MCPYIWITLWIVFAYPSHPIALAIDDCAVFELGGLTAVGTPIVLSGLRAHRSRQLEEKLLLGSCWQENNLVFTTRAGTPIEPRNLVRKFHSILKNAGLPRYRFHDLRHASASFLIAQGIAPRTVMDILGHSQISLTMNTYAHVMPVMKHDAIDLMDSILSSRR